MLRRHPPAVSPAVTPGAGADENLPPGPMTLLGDDPLKRRLEVGGDRPLAPPPARAADLLRSQ